MRLARAFLSLFGSPKKRTSDQRLVVEHLEKCAGEGQNSYQFNGVDGVAIIAAGIHRDGAKALLLVISRQISHAETAEIEKPKPTVKR